MGVRLFYDWDIQFIGKNKVYVQNVKYHYIQ